jgi:hypothetical protein
MLKEFYQSSVRTIHWYPLGTTGDYWGPPETTRDHRKVPGGIGERLERRGSFCARLRGHQFGAGVGQNRERPSRLGREGRSQEREPAIPPRKDRFQLSSESTQRETALHDPTPDLTLSRQMITAALKSWSDTARYVVMRISDEISACVPIVMIALLSRH